MKPSLPFVIIIIILAIITALFFYYVETWKGHPDNPTKEDCLKWCGPEAEHSKCVEDCRKWVLK